MSRMSLTSISITEAARRLGVHESTVRRYADRGVLRASRLPSGVRRLSRADVDALAEAVQVSDPVASTNSETETIDALIGRTGARPISDLSTLARHELWQSDEEAEQFIAMTRALRDRDR